MRGSEEVSGRFSSSPGFHVPARHHRGKVRVMLQKEEAVVQVAEEHARDENGAVGINLITSYPLLARSLARMKEGKSS